MTIQENIDYTKTRQLAEQVLDQAASEDVAIDDQLLAQRLKVAGLSAGVLTGKNIDSDELPCITIDGDGIFTRVSDKEDLEIFQQDYDMDDSFIVINY